MKERHTHRVAPFMPEGQDYWEARCVDPNCLLIEAKDLIRERLRRNLGRWDKWTERAERLLGEKPSP